MTDRTAAAVMCCPLGCRKAEHQAGLCQAAGYNRLVARLHAAGYMIVPRSPTDAMLHAGYAARTASWLEFDIYRAMTAEGELK